MRLRSLLVGLMASTVLLTPAAAHGASTQAKPDRATTTVGKVSTVNVLKNDRVGKKPKVRVISKPKAVRVTVRNNRLRLQASKPGVYRVKYSVKSSRGTAKSHLTLTVKARHLPPPPVPTIHPDSLMGRLNALPVRAETDGGLKYDRSEYKHWNRGLNSTDGCDTRREVIIAEALIKPTVGSSCSLTGGRWYSHYDGVTIEGYSSTAIDMDHMIPLEEAHSSGAWAWTAARKEAFANDQGDARSLIGVTPSSNRSKGARDPGEWIPTNKSYTCTYLEDWVAVKTRWRLSIDATEKAALTHHASTCAGNTTKPIPVTFAY